MCLSILKQLDRVTRSCNLVLKVIFEKSYQRKPETLLNETLSLRLGYEL